MSTEHGKIKPKLCTEDSKNKTKAIYWRKQNKTKLKLSTEDSKIKSN